MYMVKLGRVLVVTVALMMIVATSNAIIYRVGDGNGWKIPDGYSYNDWADQHTFAVGDILEFDFITGQDAVASVSFEDYSNCNTFSTSNVQTFGPANFTLSLGNSYFISVEDGHCLQGQKLAVNVSTYVQPGLGLGFGFGSPPYPYGPPPFPYVAPPISNRPPPPPFGNASPYIGFRSTATIPVTTCITGSLLFLFAVMSFLF